MEYDKLMQPLLEKNSTPPFSYASFLRHINNRGDIPKRQQTLDLDNYETPLASKLKSERAQRQVRTKIGQELDMKGMRKFLTQNGPWDQLISNANIDLVNLEASKEIILNKSLSVTPFHVPHRDEYSETVGFKIKGKDKTALFIPDIDKWNKWGQSIIKEIKKVDYAFIDGTFYSGVEIGHRNIAEIPHPFIEESIGLFEELSLQERNKVYFIHYNHTNPVLDTESKACKKIQDKGFNLARKNDRFKL
ncbi:MAG: hypothetical protein CBB76_01495 [Crocinitomicaceae bacterium TMED16]|nr:MAG: hypothetical protein CBB76_01495 [Crocinitomicaceae bacterium TMED16]